MQERLVHCLAWMEVKKRHYVLQKWSEKAGEPVANLNRTAESVAVADLLLVSLKVELESTMKTETGETAGIEESSMGSVLVESDMVLYCRRKRWQETEDLCLHISAVFSAKTPSSTHTAADDCYYYARSCCNWGAH